MRRLIVGAANLAVTVTVGVGCDRAASRDRVRSGPVGTPTEGPQALGPPAPDAPPPAVAPAPPPADAPPADAPAATPNRTLAVPPPLAAAPPWIGRRFMTGLIAARSTHETFTLQRAGAQALLTVTTLEASNRMSSSIGSWSQASVVQYLGTVREQAGVVTIAVANGDDAIDLTCKRTKLAVAPPEAVRERSPRSARSSAEECGDPGRWVPRTTKRLEVIRCIPFEERRADADAPDSIDPWEKLAFAAVPGIEWLHVNDDCVIQGGGWRQVPADGSIAPSRARR